MGRLDRNLFLLIDHSIYKDLTTDALSRQGRPPVTVDPDDTNDVPGAERYDSL
jgi:hypothetical protein